MVPFSYLRYVKFFWLLAVISLATKVVWPYRKGELCVCVQGENQFKRYNALNRVREIQTIRETGTTFLGMSFVQEEDVRKKFLSTSGEKCYRELSDASNMGSIGSLYYDHDFLGMDWFFMLMAVTLFVQF